MERFLKVAKKMFGEKVTEYQERASKMTKSDIDSVLEKFKAVDPDTRKKFLEEIKRESEI